MAYLGKTTDSPYHFGAFPATFELARRLRKTMTPAERILWNELKNRNLGGYKFRRQHPVREYVVDFFCPIKKLVIEIDGPIHLDQKRAENDLNRTAELENMGLKVIRFSNEEIFQSLEEVLKKIETTLTPPLLAGEGAGG